jgi:hypothetical protein
MKFFKQFINELREPTNKIKEACWKGYTAAGTKQKGGRTVPNCVPVKEDHVKELENGLQKLDSHDYDTINELMMKICKKNNITGKELHKDFVSKHGKTPDNWIKHNLKEDLRKWFKQKWVRMDTKGNIKGHCAREPGEGKPKCLPQSKAHAIGKEGRASAAQRKRREDPNPERHGAPINVRTESAAAAIAAATAISKKKSGNYDSEGFRKTPYKNPDHPLRKSNAERKREQK